MADLPNVLQLPWGALAYTLMPRLRETVFTATRILAT